MRCGTSAVEGTPQKLSAASAQPARGRRRRVSNHVSMPGGKFPKTARLLKHADFDRVYRAGRRQFSAHMTIFWLARDVAGTPREMPPAAILTGPRIGFTVSRVMGGSVVRNRIRRRLREAVRVNLAQLSASVDVVINPKKSTVNADFPKLIQEVAEAFRAIQQGKTGRAR